MLQLMRAKMNERKTGGLENVIFYVSAMDSGLLYRDGRLYSIAGWCDYNGWLENTGNTMCAAIIARYGKSWPSMTLEIFNRSRRDIGDYHGTTIKQKGEKTQ